MPHQASRTAPALHTHATRNLHPPPVPRPTHRCLPPAFTPLPPLPPSKRKGRPSAKDLPEELTKKLGDANMMYTTGR